MLDMNEVYNAISNIGFPICACVYMGKMYKESIDKLSSVVSSNTRALDRVLDKLDIDYNEGEEK